MRILLVEDDKLLGDGIRAGLRQDGYTVDWVGSGEDALHALQAESFDLVVLDIGLPGQDGLSVLAQMRRKGNLIPVIVLTARDAVVDRITGLDHGADDYLVKPFDLDELSARVRALIRRSMGRATLILEQQQLTLDPASHVVTFAGQPVEIPPREFTLLRMLMENAGKVVPKSRLQESLYGWDQDVESNALEVHIHHLRKRFDPEMIKTVRGVGYMLVRTEQSS